jgi:hypothetical protein
VAALAFGSRRLVDRASMKPPYTPEQWEALTEQERGTCVLWTGPFHPNGYGVRKDAKSARKKYGTDRTHRIAWIEAYGVIPDGLCVLHHCDTRACMRVDHLFLGDRGDNARDMHRKKRGRESRKTMCPKCEQPYTGTNKVGGRVCVPCARQSTRDWRARQKEEVVA